MSMEVPKPDGPDENRGTSYFIGCWVLTGLVFLVLAFRYSVKAWMRWILPDVSKPGRIWGWDDFFYALGFAFDATHMAIMWKSWSWGLGRHFYYLTPLERMETFKWDFINQPFAVAASMWYRTGVIIFLYTCLARNTQKIKWLIVFCGILQIAVNLATILQIVLQCGPNPYRPANRLAYYHYMWDPLPEDGSAKCLEPTAQAMTGIVQGSFNAVIDFTLVYLAAFEIWQILFRLSNHETSSRSLLKRFQRLDRHVRRQRIWQTILLCGPLIISGVACIIKTCLIPALGNRLDFTWNIVPFGLWVKIENACIPIATCAPVLRLFTRTYVDRRRNGSTSNYVHSSSNRRRRDEEGTMSEVQRQRSHRSDKHMTRSEVVPIEEDHRRSFQRHDSGVETLTGVNVVTEDEYCSPIEVEVEKMNMVDDNSRDRCGSWPLQSKKTEYSVETTEKRPSS